MHWEQGNKMAFHAIILCNKALGGRKMINNVSCVRQLLPKIKRSSPPSAAPARAQVRALPHSTGAAAPAGARAAAAPARPHGPVGICRMQLGGQKGTIHSGCSGEWAASHRRAWHPQASATRMLLGKGTRQSCSHLRPVAARTRAKRGVQQVVGWLST